MGRIGTTTGLLVAGVVLAAGLQGCGGDGGSARAEEGAASAAVPALSSTSPSTSPSTSSPSSVAAAKELVDSLLPNLLPAVDLPRVGPGQTISDPVEPEVTLGIEVTGEQASEDSVEKGQARLVVSGFGRTRSVALPAGWTPAVFGKRFDLGQAGSAWIVSQEGGDSDAWSVYLDTPDALVPLQVTGGVGFGSGYDDEGTQPFRTWVTRSGRIFTSVGIDGDRFHLYEWQVPGPGEGPVEPGTSPAPSVPALVPADLGVACADDPVSPTAFTRC